jgi:hypothetical protein
MKHTWVAHSVPELRGLGTVHRCERCGLLRARRGFRGFRAFPEFGRIRRHPGGRHEWVPVLGPKSKTGHHRTPPCTEVP